MSGMRLDGIESIKLSTFFERRPAEHGYRRIAFVTSGYERRSSFWTGFLIQNEMRDRFSCIHVIGFGEHNERLSRPLNDSFYASAGLEVHRMASDDRAAFVSHFRSMLQCEREMAGGIGLEVHVDYSCMPRSWYCELPTLLNSELGINEAACLWYSKGIYPIVEYPTAGVEDFRIFAGIPSLEPGRRTHLFGLGFDKIRSHAIWSVLEPKNLVCYFAERGTLSDYSRKVRNDNADILAACSFTFTVPIDDFVSAFSRIRSTILDFRLQGDVIIVPDGPKPLVLGSSLVPLSIDRKGVVCLHVRRRRDPDIQIVDVEGTGIPTGFLMYGGR
jgi:hypothetical protein